MMLSGNEILLVAPPTRQPKFPLATEAVAPQIIVLHHGLYPVRAHSHHHKVVHSFRKDGTSIVDHHTASQQFMTHDLREKRVGRECPAQW